MPGLSSDLTIIAWDDPTFDAWVVEVAGEFRRRGLVEGYGIAIDELPSGTVVRSTLVESPIRHARTQGSGIAAATSVTQMTSGTVDLWLEDDSGALSDSTLDATAWNKASLAVPANTHVLIQADEYGKDVVVWVENRDGENKRFVITTSIVARTSSTAPSSGTATLYDWDGSAWVARSPTVTLYNQWKDAIPASAHGRAVYENGSWFALVWNCTGG